MSIKAIKGQKTLDRKLLFGVLSFVEEGRLYLEDPEDSIRLDLTNVDNFIPALYTETSMVVVGGSPNGDCFSVEFISPPPLESRVLSTETISYPNLLAGSAIADSMLQCRAMEKEYTDVAVVILSDVWLDCARTLAKVEMLFRGFESATVPAAFVIMGPFVSNLQRGTPALGVLHRVLSNLAEMIHRYPVISRQSKFVLVPALDDPLAPKILPRPPLPAELLEPFKHYSIDCVFASNPARLYIFTKEIVLFRRDCTVALKKNLIPDLSRDITDQCGTFRAILEQAHLCALPLSIQPRTWEYDHALSIYPSPDFLVIGERSRPTASQETDGCLGINPGSFATSEFSFALLYPMLGKIEAWYDVFCY
jgi:DNA polymerase epsilon subunit 2